MTTKDHVGAKLKNVQLSPPLSPIGRLPEEWSEILGTWGQPKFRGMQVFKWIHGKGVLDPDKMSNLPKSLRARLKEELTPEKTDGTTSMPLTLTKGFEAEDRTRKLLVRMNDGLEVETVLIPQLEREQDQPLPEGWTPHVPVTQCISSQVGCAMGCVFCASGVAGLKRHLNAGEIVGQLLIARSLLDEERGERLRNVVFMGMGEPLHNYDAVARALVLMTHPDGLNLSTRRVTVSTSGLIPEIDRLGSDFDGRVALAISLHATSDRARSSIMPINKKYPLSDLVACIKRYPLRKRQRVTLEYTLIEGVNDGIENADRLAKLMRGAPVKVNVIPMNPISASDLCAPSAASLEAFCDRLRSRHMTVMVRRERGQDVDAACGQLALYGEDGLRLERRRRLPVQPN